MKAKGEATMPQRLNLPLVTRVCGKARHYTKAAADAHRAALEQWERAREETRAGTLVTYWCEQCTAFHVGHRRQAS
jgi:hypothetical protein